MTAFPGHLAISASAGTGKTFQLAHRFVQLLMLGESPERIIALTFSRKAAREIFDRVIRILAEASLSAEKARAANEHVRAGDKSTLDYQQALRRLLEKLPRSRVGTIDSFTVGVVRAFPYELGLEPDFKVFDNGGVEAKWCRSDALRVVLQSAATNSRERTQFFEAYKFATFGHEEKSSTRLLNEMMIDYQSLFRLQPDERSWGLAVDTTRPSCADHAAWLEAIERFRLLVIAQNWPAGVTSYWAEFCDELPDWRPEKDFTNRISYVCARIIPLLKDLGASDIPLKFNRSEFILSKKAGHALLPILHYMGDEAIRLHSIRSKGMYHLISRCETVYDQQIRRRGFLTFEDALYALRNENIAMEPGAGRLSIDYRLDGKLDHWLLDEFQDTSTVQWQVLHNLIDEVVQDAEKRRTFFYVGDVKQAIYGWRGGNAALFDQILKQYNHGSPPVIECRPLDKSFRSGRPIIESVNRVFGSLSPLVDENVRQVWNSIWHRHDCADGIVPAKGYVALVEKARLERDSGLNADEERLKAAADIIAAIDPVARGITAALLCRGNSTAKAMADTLRQYHPHIPVALEGKSFITDNPAVSLLLSLLQWAEHPGDMFAWRHLQMSPLSASLPSAPCEILASVLQYGIHQTLADWVEKLEAVSPLTPFERMRVGQFLELAAQRDRDTGQSIDRFVEMAREAAVEDSASRQAVRIMTIHKSKGLDFDVVVLPDLQGRGGGSNDAMISWSEDRTVPEWILHYMRKHLVGLDSRLSACMEKEAIRDGVEDLCVLYVAMTRAARALYLVTTDQGEDSVSANHARFIKDALAGDDSGRPCVVNGCNLDAKILYDSGDPDWFGSVMPASAPVVTGEQEPTPTCTFAFKGEDRALPSQGAEFERDAGRVFTSSMRERREIGSAVHAIFEKIEWLDNPAQVDEIIDRDASLDVVRHVRDCIEKPELAALFKRPDGRVDVWREQSFEIMMDGKWTSGVFDRVVIERGSDGGAIRAQIIDYKTNRLEKPEQIEELTKHYQPQLESYRDVLCRLINLSPKKVALKLVFTNAGTVRTL
ncbi:MAG TPA: UvrD-helicase domain-containing protein [Kiritimatiellia bacterium]|nr:UvrD-helicase domain-containing protein [Kiritimatiellia bacterium]